MERRDFFFALIELWQSRARTINELADNIAPFLTEAFAYEPDGLKEYVHGKDLLGMVESFREALLQGDPVQALRWWDELGELVEGNATLALQELPPGRWRIGGHHAHHGSAAKSQ